MRSSNSRSPVLQFAGSPVSPFSSMRKLFSLLPALLLLTATVVSAQNPHLVVYEGNKGPGAGKHIVLISGDHEYRSEESLPALARILAQRYGFKCSVFFTVDPDSGFIDP